MSEYYEHRALLNCITNNDNSVIQAVSLLPCSLDYICMNQCIILAMAMEEKLIPTPVDQESMEFYHKALELKDLAFRELSEKSVN
jgi:hypothetical protein